MGDSTNLTLVEIREKACTEASPSAYERLAKKLINELHLAESAGDSAGAGQFSDELRALAGAHLDQPGLMDTYAASLYNSHTKIAEPEGKDRLLSLLVALREIESSDRRTPMVVQCYATALNNTHVRAGKWGDRDLGRYAREELARISEHPQASSQVIDFFATSLSDGHSRLTGAGDHAGASALLSQLKQLAARYPNNKLISNRLAKALANVSTAASRASSAGVADQELDGLREMYADPDRSAAVEDQLMLALSNTYIGLGAAVKTERAEALLSEARRLCDQSRQLEVRGNFAKILRNKHYHLVKAGEFEIAEAPVQELLLLEQRFQGQVAVVEQLAATLQNGCIIARQAGKAALAVSYLTVFRGLYQRYLYRAAVFEPYAQCLNSNLLESLSNPGYGMSEALLAELQAMRRAHPVDSKVRGYHANALGSIHAHAVKSDDLARAQSIRGELRKQLTTGRGANEAVGEFAALLAKEVTYALNIKQVDSADSHLWELRSLHSAYPESEATVTALADSLLQWFAFTIKEGDPMAKGSLQELRELDKRFPTSARVPSVLIAMLALWHIYTLYKGIYDQADATLDEARTVYDRGLPGEQVALIYARILSAAIGADLARFRIGAARVHKREFDEVVELCSSNNRLADKAVDLRKDLTKNCWQFFRHAALPETLVMFLSGLICGHIVVSLFLKKH